MTIAVAPPTWRRYVPIAGWLPRYRRSYVAGDLLAGLVVAALAIPQSLGYAGIAGVPILVGLYAIPLAPVAYPLLGPSRPAPPRHSCPSGAGRCNGSGTCGTI